MRGVAELVIGAGAVTVQLTTAALVRRAPQRVAGAERQQRERCVAVMIRIAVAGLERGVEPELR